MKNTQKHNAIEYLIQTANKYPEKIGFQDAQTQLSFQDFLTTSSYISTHLLKMPPPGR